MHRSASPNISVNVSDNVSGNIEHAEKMSTRLQWPGVSNPRLKTQNKIESRNYRESERKTARIPSDKRKGARRMQKETLVPGSISEDDLIRLVDTYSGILLGLCRLTLGDTAMAQDIVQGTFLKAWKKATGLY